MDFKKFHLGKLIKKRVQELEIEEKRLVDFLKCKEEELSVMYAAESADTALLLKWCKILDYDFFRIYSQHLILHGPISVRNTNLQKKTTQLPQFRKNIYSKEIINYLLELINTGKKTKAEIIDQYGIPKTTLYKWIAKNKTIEI